MYSLACRDRGIEGDPGKLVFGPNGLCWWKRFWIIQGGNCDIYSWPVGCIFEEDLGSAARCKGSYSAGIWNAAESAAKEFKLFSMHDAPGPIRRSGTATAVEAMTVD